ncbi:hypothetical protein, partial [Thiolapillus sp.]
SNNTLYDLPGEKKPGQRGRRRKYGRRLGTTTEMAAQVQQQACLRPRDRFWDIPVPKIDSAFDNLFVPQPSWSPSTTQQLRKLVAAPYLAPNDWTPRLDAYFAYPLALCARRVSSAASRLLGSTSLRFALHGWQRRPRAILFVSMGGNVTLLLMTRLSC